MVIINSGLVKQFIYQMSINTITLDEFKEICNYLLDNNKRLVDEGKKPTAICLEGEAGIGKTETVMAIAVSRNMTIVKLNLAEIEEPADMLGFPLKEYKLKVKQENEEFKEEWVAHDLLDLYLRSACEDFQLTGEVRMSYATPAWLPREENPNGTIIFLDDFSRANSIILACVLELINTGKYISWKLPKYTQIILSSNPDNGMYQVTGLDPAMQSRMVNFPIKFDIHGWSRWAEYAQMDSRAVNFALMYSSEIFESENKTINARSYTTFCNAISGLKDWSETKTLAMILNIAKGCFDDKDNVVGHLFTMFIANKLDKLISPEDLLNKDWAIVSQEVKKCVYDEHGNYRPDIASVLSTRLLNYTSWYFEQSGSKSDPVQKRLLEFIDSPEMLFSEDLFYNVIKQLATNYPSRMNKVILNPKIRKKLI